MQLLGKFECYLFLLRISFNLKFFGMQFCENFFIYQYCWVSLKYFKVFYDQCYSFSLVFTILWCFFSIQNSSLHQKSEILIYCRPLLCNTNRKREQIFPTKFIKTQTTPKNLSYFMLFTKNKNRNSFELVTWQ